MAAVHHQLFRLSDVNASMPTSKLRKLLCRSFFYSRLYARVQGFDGPFWGVQGVQGVQGVPAKRSYLPDYLGRTVSLRSACHVEEAVIGC